MNIVAGVDFQMLDNLDCQDKLSVSLDLLFSILFALSAMSSSKIACARMNSGKRIVMSIHMALRTRHK
ncbi:hypothetical protein MY3296_005398 [Beauveria thailandica]